MEEDDENINFLVGFSLFFKSHLINGLVLLLYVKKKLVVGRVTQFPLSMTRDFETLWDWISPPFSSLN